MSQQEGWEQVLKPWLIAKRDQSFPDPSQFKRDEEFNYAAKVASVFKKVVAEILVYVEQQKEVLDFLNKKKFNKNNKDPFKIGKPKEVK
jgi:hypothetical protein